ncbi:MAG TPA: T9SS type A sorting domain-containing protein [Bacteroidales bacterium]|nr:T9SS type A sorting domain-containing protein [Bacteroidales bacterium]
MKKILFALNFLILINISSALAADCYAINSGNWNNAATWQNGLIPSESDNVFINNGVTIYIKGSYTCNNLYMNGSNIEFENGNRTLTINGDLVIEADNNEIIGGGSGNRYLQINGNLYIYQNATLNISNHSITVNKETNIKGKLSINSNTGDKTFNNININNNGILECNTSVDIIIKGDLINNGIFIPNEGTYTFNGTNEQNISSISDISFYNLTIDNPQRIIMNNNVIASNQLFMKNGNIIVDVTDTLILGTSTTQLGKLIRNNGTIIGNFRRWFASRTINNVLFPIGTNDFYRPAIISFTTAPTSGGTITTSFIEFDPQVTNLPINDGGFQITNYGTDGYWQMIPGDNLTGGQYNLSLYITGFQKIINGLDISNLRIIKQNISSNQWVVNGTHQIGTWSNDYPMIRRIGMMEFGKYALAGSNNPLPIELLYFNATANNELVELSWSTASEINNDFFTIEYSNELANNGTIWTPLFMIDGAGNSNTPLIYTFIDRPYLRDNNTNVVFYRLKQTDIDGKYKYYGVVFVRYNYIDEDEKNIIITYDPSINENKINIMFNATESNQYQINIYDINGKLITTNTGQSIDGTNNVTMQINNFNSSIYIIVLNIGQQVLTQKILIDK